MSTIGPPDDNRLYDLLAQDNEEAFCLLYNKYWKKMLYKAMIKLGNETDAEEIVQDTFLDIWKSRHRIQIRHTFHTYIAAVVRYKVMAKMAANQKLADHTFDDVNQLQISDNSTQQWLNFSDLRDEIEQTVKALPEKCQLVFRLSREAGMSDKQIAARLELSQKTVEAHLSKALKTLRTSLKQISILLLFIIH